jgi:hypothetical protein
MKSEKPKDKERIKTLSKSSDIERKRNSENNVAGAYKSIRKIQNGKFLKNVG